MSHIVATITGHGLGHLSLSAPVLNKLFLELPDLKLTLISAIPEKRLRERISAPFDHLHSDLDFGMYNDSRLSVQKRATMDAYRQLHKNWPQRVQTYARQLDCLNCDLLFSNVSYLSLAAAKSIDLPCVALSPLNWADMYKYFCRHAEGYRSTHEEILSAYNAADVFLRPTPTMPMPELTNTIRVGPIAAVGEDRRQLVCKQLRVKASTKLALVAIGGHVFTPSVTWPRNQGIHWMVTGTVGSDQANVSILDALDVPFLDLLASCDVVISKPGYGIFTETTCAGKPVLFVRRPDWPEEIHLIKWLELHNRCKELSLINLQNGSFVEDIVDLLDGQQSPTPALKPTGVDEVTVLISKLLS